MLENVIINSLFTTWGNYSENSAFELFHNVVTLELN